MPGDRELRQPRLVLLVEVEGDPGEAELVRVAVMRCSRFREEMRSDGEAASSSDRRSKRGAVYGSFLSAAASLWKDFRSRSTLYDEREGGKRAS